MKLPLIVKSKYCVWNFIPLLEADRYDLGGCFIINGNEKVLIAQEKLHPILSGFQTSKAE